MEKLADGHRLIFNNFRRQQQRTNHINSFKIEEMEKAMQEHRRIVEEISVTKNDDDDEDDVNDLVVQLGNSVDNLTEQINKQQTSQQNKISEMKMQYDRRVNTLETALEALQKSHDEKFSQMLGAMKNLGQVSEGLKKEVAILRIENQFMKDN